MIYFIKGILWTVSEVGALSDWIQHLPTFVQGAAYVLASSAAPDLKDASDSGSGGLGGSGAQEVSGDVKTPVKKSAVAVGQKKPGEPVPAALQPAK